MKQLASILLFSLLLIINNVYSQQYTFTNYSINEGLSQSVVNCVFQDSKGYIWLGTQNGLDRFDGRNFELYRFNPADSNSISNNWIYAISEDRDENLWIGTKGGLHKYIRGENRFELIHYQTGYEFDVTNYSYDNICLKNGDILINTPPVVSLYNSAKDTFSHFINKFEYDASVKDVKIPVMEDKNGNIWIGSTVGLAVLSPESKNFSYYSFLNSGGQSFNNANITALFEDKAGNIWAGTDAGLYKLNLITGNFETVQFILEDGSNLFIESCIRSIIQDKDDNLIIGTEGNGIYYLIAVSEQVYKVLDFTINNSGIGHNIVQCLLIDRSENLWAGTLSGISKTDLKQKKFKVYRNNNLPGSTNLLGNVMAGLFKDDKGIIWAGNWGQGLNLVNPETNEVEHFSSQHSGNNFLPNDFVHAIFKDSEKNVWLGTRNGIFIFDEAQKRFVQWTEFLKRPNYPTFENTRIYHIIHDKNNNVWIASSNGLYKINVKDASVEVFHTDAEPEQRLSANLIYSLLEDSEGLIWIASINGLGMYNPSTREIKHFTQENNGLSSDFLISLCEDVNGKIWIGSNAYINIFDKNKDEFSYLGKEHGLPSNYIYEIQKDKNGDLWLATGNGLCRFDRESEQLEIFTQEDGLQSLEFNLRASFVCTNGELLFGGMNGFNSFFPDSISGNPYVPVMEFTSFTKNENEKEEKLYLKTDDKVVLKRNVQSFNIEFAALEFTNPENNHYAYKMEGVSDEWVEIGNRTFVPFFALPPGDYSFWVKGSNNDGLWNNQPIHINIIVLPPWWRSIYAYITYLILIVLGVVIFVKLREEKLQQAKILLEKKVTERTLQVKEQNRIITSKNEELNELNRTKDKFFSIIGHDLGNHFNIIVGFSELLLSGFRKMDEKKQEQHLTNIFRSSKHANDLLGNLLTWARLQRNAIEYRPEKIEAVDKVRKLIGFHEEAALKKNILIEVFAKDEIEIYTDENMFSTILRNLLSNAIKFTPNNGEISIQLKIVGDFCKIEVKDNGIGIPNENINRIFEIDSNVSTKGTEGEKGTGLGLILCKEFIEKHGGEIWVESKVGKGSCFVFTLPLETS